MATYRIHGGWMCNGLQGLVCRELRPTSLTSTQVSETALEGKVSNPDMIVVDIRDVLQSIASLLHRLS